MAETKIEWAERVWNPTIGCRRVSAGCEHCYAERFAGRLAAMGRQEYRGLLSEDGRWNGTVRCLHERLNDPLRWKKPARIFVDSMSDLFHENVPYEFLKDIWTVMVNAEHHTFMILTKRPNRMAEKVDLLLRDGFGVLKNVWLGVSVENQTAADERIPLLLETPAAVRFMSCEPLLGPVDLRNIRPANFKNRQDDVLTGKTAIENSSLGAIFEGGKRLDWVIVGGETGPGARPMAYEWVDSILDQCLSAGVPFFFKQWGEWYPSPYQGSQTDHGGYPFDLKTNTIRIGRKKSGRLLDGRTWDQYPTEMEGEK